jgi:hypothetical protein
MHLPLDVDEVKYLFKQAALMKKRKQQITAELIERAVAELQELRGQVKELKEPSSSEVRAGPFD